MAAISQVIPNLLGGVSQQPDPLKLPGQVREAENVLLDPTFGCRKRPPTQFIKKISSDVPATAKWFEIFRDNNERYVVSIYRADDKTKVRVWEADTGLERTVTIKGSAESYLDVEDPVNIRQLTINDYTLLCNSEKNVTMSGSVTDVRKPECLAIVNQVAYNTTYKIDFLKAGEQLGTEKVYRATKLSVNPGSFEKNDEGSCEFATSESFNKSSGDKTGLAFTLTTQCTPKQVTKETDGEPYPVAVETEQENLQIWATYHFGIAENYAVGSYLYRNFSGDTAAGNLSCRVEVRVSEGSAGNRRYDLTDASITSYDSSGDKKWDEGRFIKDEITLNNDLDRCDEECDTVFPKGSTASIKCKVSSVREGPKEITYSYKSVYRSTVTLNNGGVNWRVGDKVEVEMKGKNYRIIVEEEDFGYAYSSEASVSYTTALNQETGPLSVDQIVGDLVTSINALDGYKSTPIGNTIHIQREDDRDFNIQASGGSVNNALLSIKSSVNDVSLLPNQCVPGVVLLVRNSAESDADDYYVKFKSAAGDIPGQGSWEETVKPGIDTQLNLSTMPHVMVREQDGKFTIRPLSPEYDDTLYWAGREVGDEESNPTPSFVGQPVQDMFFYMNRLGFLSSDTVVLSQPGDFFNFFVGSAISVSDADPIDMAASSTKPATLKAAAGTPKGLLLFAENSQFLMSTSEAAFGPSTVKMAELSNYSYSSDVHPLETGVSILFATEADTYSKVYEMAVDSIDNRPLVSENTRIVPEYIPPGLKTSAASPNNSLCMFGDGSDTLYTFKFFNTGNERSLAGWSKWVMPGPVDLVGFDHDTGYFVVQNGDDHIILKMEMLDDPRTSPIEAFGSKFAPRLDCSLLKTQVTIKNDEATSTSKVYFPDGAYVEDMQPNIIITVDGSSTLYTSPDIEDDDDGYFITTDTSVTTGDFIVGLEYTMRVELPAFFVTQDKKADRRNIPMVENVYLDLYYSGRYQVEVERTGYIKRTVDLDVTDADLYLANSAAIDETVSRQVPVYSRGDFAKLTISAPDPLPASITSYRWEGHYNNRGIAIL